MFHLVSHGYGTLFYLIKAQGASERAERQPFKLERFSERGRDRIGQKVSGCSEMKLSLTKCGAYCHDFSDMP